MEEFGRCAAAKRAKIMQDFCKSWWNKLRAKSCSGKLIAVLAFAFAPLRKYIIIQYALLKSSSYLVTCRPCRCNRVQLTNVCGWVNNYCNLQQIQLLVVTLDQDKGCVCIWLNYVDSSILVS